MRSLVILFLAIAVPALAIDVRPGPAKVDGVTLQNVGGTLSVKDAGISAAKLASATWAASAAVNSWNGGNCAGTPVEVNGTSARISITTTGRPVMLAVQPIASGTVGSEHGVIYANVSAATTTHSYIWRWERSDDGGSTWTGINGHNLSTYRQGGRATASTTGYDYFDILPEVDYSAPAGAHLYRLKICHWASTHTLWVTYVRLIATQL